MTETNKKDPVKMSPITMFFGLGIWVVLFIGLIFRLVKCFSGDSVSSAQQKKWKKNGNWELIYSSEINYVAIGNISGSHNQDYIFCMICSEDAITRAL
jgi:hypothetical protein